MIQCRKKKEHGRPAGVGAILFTRSDSCKSATRPVIKGAYQSTTLVKKKKKNSQTFIAMFEKMQKDFFPKREKNTMIMIVYILEFPRIRY